MVPLTNTMLLYFQSVFFSCSRAYYFFAASAGASSVTCGRIYGTDSGEDDGTPLKVEIPYLYIYVLVRVRDAAGRPAASL